MENNKLQRAADNIRILAASMVEKAKSGHPGGAMGGADFINVLYTEFLRYDPDNMAYPTAIVCSSTQVTCHLCSMLCSRWLATTRLRICSRCVSGRA